MIIDYGKNYTILIIAKNSITINRKNQLIAHPYGKSSFYTSVASSICLYTYWDI